MAHFLGPVRSYYVVLFSSLLSLLAGAAADGVQAPTAWQPFHTAVVNLSVVPAYLPSAAAAGLLAAAVPGSDSVGSPRKPTVQGWPADPSLSRPPLRRDFGAASVEIPAVGVAPGSRAGSGKLINSNSGSSGSSGSSATLAGGGLASARLEGPSALPVLPDVDGSQRHRHRSSRRRRRALTQAAGAPYDPTPGHPLAEAPGACLSSASPPGTFGAAAQQQQQQQQQTTPAAASCLSSRGGWSGLDASAGGSVALAVGPKHALQVAGGVATLTMLGAAGLRGAHVRTFALRDLFAAVAPGCAPAPDADALYDAGAGRFVLAAPCGGYGRLLLAASASSDPSGAWFLFGLVADGVGTALECRAPAEQSLAERPRLSVNADGVYVSYHAHCPSRPEVAGAALLALPKHKVYDGSPAMYYAAYTAAEVAAAAASAGAGAPLPGGAAGVRQLQPVVAAGPDDVAEGVAFFVAEQQQQQPQQSQPTTTVRSAFTLVALANTGALWGYAGGLNGVPSPALLASSVLWSPRDGGASGSAAAGSSPVLRADARLKQPDGGADLAAGGLAPAGFWPGAAVLSRGQIVLATRGDSATADGGSATPGVVWAEVAPKLSWTAPAAGQAADGTSFTTQPATCGATLASGMAESHDWARDASGTWGSQFARNWSASLAAFKAASALPAAPRVAIAADASSGPRAAAVVLDRESRLAEAARASPAANFVAMGLPPPATRAAAGVGSFAGSSSRFGGAAGGAARGYYGRSGACGCESSCGYGDLQSYNYVYQFDDYCDAGNNQWGPQSGNDMWGTTYNGAYCTGNAAFGLVGNSQYDQCSRWCAIRCPAAGGGVGAFVAPRYNFYGATNQYPQLVYASLPEVVAVGDGSGSSGSAAGAAAAASAAASLPSVAIAAATVAIGAEGRVRAAAAGGGQSRTRAAVTQPMRAAACAAAASLSGEVVRAGAVAAPPGLGLAHPAVAAAPNGAIAIVFTASSSSSGSGSGSAGVYPSVGAAVVGAADRGRVPMALLARGAAPIVPPRTSDAADASGDGAAQQPAAATGVEWGEHSAAATHPVTGAVYVAARRGAPARTVRPGVSTWVGVLMPPRVAQ